MNIEAVILAAGQGSRMKSDLPKVLHPIGGKPMVKHVLDACQGLVDKTHLVVGHGSEKVQATLANESVSFAMQAEQLGTGHAVAQAMPQVSEDALVVVLYGDVPLIKADTIKQLITLAGSGLALLTATISNPTGYGRIVRNSEGQVQAIVEEKDASVEQKAITEVNTGILAVSASFLNQALPQLSSNNAQGEYYLTDVIAMAVEAGLKVATVNPSCFEETLGVNNRQQQASLERWYQARLADDLMVQGVTLADPARLDIRGNVRVGRDVFIDVNSVLEGDITLGDGVQIGPNCHLNNVTVAAGTTINSHSVLEQTIVGQDCNIGPFARLRPGTELADKAKIGNFVETKKAVIGPGSKVNHLSYVGDAKVAEDVNIGAGTITCNYDGANKFQTVIGAGSFVGSNSTLVAPVTLATETFVAAGSVITKDTDEGKLVINRGKQKTVEGWKRPKKENS